MERPIFSPQVATVIIFGKEEKMEGGRRSYSVPIDRFSPPSSGILVFPTRIPTTKRVSTEHRSLVRKKEIILATWEKRERGKVALKLFPRQRRQKE